MSIEGIVLGLLAIIIGAAWAFYGLKLFTVLLPIWAFFFGIVAGAQLGQDLFGQGFFGTVTSWIIGLVVGIVFAVLAWLWYYAAVVLAFGVLGYAIGVGLLSALGIDSGVLGTIVGLAVGALFAVGAFLLGIPAWLIVFVSAVSGAAAIVNGVLIVLGRIQVADLEDGLMGGLLTDGLVGIVAFLVIAAVAIFYQLRAIGQAVIAIDRTAYRY